MTYLAKRFQMFFLITVISVVTAMSVTACTTKPLTDTETSQRHFDKTVIEAAKKLADIDGLSLEKISIEARSETKRTLVFNFLKDNKDCETQTIQFENTDDPYWIPSIGGHGTCKGEGGCYICSSPPSGSCSCSLSLPWATNASCRVGSSAPTFLLKTLKGLKQSEMTPRLILEK